MQLLVQLPLVLSLMLPFPLALQLALPWAALCLVQTHQHLIGTSGRRAMRPTGQTRLLHMPQPIEEGTAAPVSLQGIPLLLLRLVVPANVQERIYLCPHPTFSQQE